jgi:CheY-like chemotaxis protein
MLAALKVRDPNSKFIYPMKKIRLACLVEDDPLHVFITKKYIEMSGKVVNLMVCNNGKEAFDTLSTIIKEGEPLPEIIFLDLNMPIWNGWQFLEEFTKIPIDQKIIIYILTSSNNPEDLKKAEGYNLRSNYLIKPITPVNLKKVFDLVLH